MNENTLTSLESGSEDEALNLLKDFNVKVWHTAKSNRGTLAENFVKYSAMTEHKGLKLCDGSLAVENV